VTRLSGHAVLVGYGRVGSVVGVVLVKAGVPLLVIENDPAKVARLRAQGIETIDGNAADPEVMQAANLGAAKTVLIAIPDGFEAGQVGEQARAINKDLWIIARAHSEDEIVHLKRHGVSTVIMGEHLIAHAIIEDIRHAGVFPNNRVVEAAEISSAAAPPDSAITVE
jgi:CPA2 family monovalent cation:H+ antiporter-2